MRWTGGQWPQQTQMLADMSQQSLTGNVCDDSLGQRPQNQVMIDQQQLQTIQQQLCVEQFQLLNQLQVNVTERFNMLFLSAHLTIFLIETESPTTISNITDSIDNGFIPIAQYWDAIIAESANSKFTIDRIITTTAISNKVCV